MIVTRRSIGRVAVYAYHWTPAFASDCDLQAFTDRIPLVQAPSASLAVVPLSFADHLSTCRTRLYFFYCEFLASVVHP